MTKFEAGDIVKVHDELGTVGGAGNLPYLVWFIRYRDKHRYQVERGALNMPTVSEARLILGRATSRQKAEKVLLAQVRRHSQDEAHA